MTVTSDRQAAYRQRQKAAGLVQLNIWCRPQDRDTIRAYAESLAEGVTSDKPKGEPLPETVEELKARAARVKTERKAKRKAGEPCASYCEWWKAMPKPPPSIPQRCTDNPTQLRRVMQYHHPDKNNAGASVKIFQRAVNKLARVRKLST